MQLRLLLLAALWMWPSLALAVGSGVVAALFETKTQVFEGVLDLRPPTTANVMVVKIERRHIASSDCNLCLLTSDPPAFLMVDRVIKDEPVIRFKTR